MKFRDLIETNRKLKDIKAYYIINRMFCYDKDRRETAVYINAIDAAKVNPTINVDSSGAGSLYIKIGCLETITESYAQYGNLDFYIRRPSYEILNNDFNNCNTTYANDYIKVESLEAAYIENESDRKFFTDAFNEILDGNDLKVIALYVNSGNKLCNSTSNLSIRSSCITPLMMLGFVKLDLARNAIKFENGYKICPEAINCELHFSGPAFTICQLEYFVKYFTETKNINFSLYEVRDGQWVNT